MENICLIDYGKISDGQITNEDVFILLMIISGIISYIFCYDLTSDSDGFVEIIVKLIVILIIYTGISLILAFIVYGGLAGVVKEIIRCRSASKNKPINNLVYRNIHIRNALNELYQAIRKITNKDEIIANQEIIGHIISFDEMVYNIFKKHNNSDYQLDERTTHIIKREADELI